MKTLLNALILMTMLLAPAGVALGYPVNIGDQVMVESYDSSTGGGEFLMTASNGNSWKSFCLEKYEYFYPPNDWNWVGGINPYAVGGGTDSNNPEYPPNDGNTGNNQDYISHFTAYLYWNFSLGTLGSDTYRYTQANQADLQRLIWHLEDEITLNSFTAHQQNWLSLADVAVNGDNWQNNGQVAVLNLYQTRDGDTYSGARQDVLVVATVPEPGTLVLIGVGLLGLGFFGHRRMKK